MTRREIQIASPSTGDAEWEALREPIDTGWLTHGPKVSQFEREFAGRHGCARGVATTSCTTALHLALVALGVGDGDEVIVPALTWVATANVVVFCGATPVFCDVDLSTYNLDPGDLAGRITDRTRAVIPVHLFGLCADMTPIREAVPDEVPLIEDAACAAGAGYRGEPAGSLGDVGCFSFHPRKVITTGEGGMITTNNEHLADRAEILRNHGATIPEEARHHGMQPWLLPDFDELGFNYRMTDLQGAVGLTQLEKLDRFVEERRERARFYERELADLDWLTTPYVPDDCAPSWQAYVCRVEAEATARSREEIMADLHAVGVSTRPGTHTVHTLGYYRDRFALSAEDFPRSDECGRQTLAIPLHNEMSDQDYHYVVEKLHEVEA